MVHVEVNKVHIQVWIPLQLAHYTAKAVWLIGY